jgi:hypothetical protein
MNSHPGAFGLASSSADLGRLAGAIAPAVPAGTLGLYIQVLKGIDLQLSVAALEGLLKERFKEAEVIVEVVPTTLLRHQSGCPVLTVSGMAMDRAEVLRRRRERAELAPEPAFEEEAGVTEVIEYGGTLAAGEEQEARALGWQASNAKGDVVCRGEWDLPRKGLRFGAALGRSPRTGTVAVDGPGGELVAHDFRRREWGFSRDQFMVDWEQLRINGQAPTRLLFEPGSGGALDLPVKQGERHPVGLRAIWTVRTHPDLVRLRNPPPGMSPEDAAVVELRFAIL